MVENILYLDCASGISGDMILGALLDLNAPSERLQTVIDQLGLEASLNITKVQKNGEKGKRVKVEAEERKPKGLEDIKNLLHGSGLDSNIVKKSEETFQNLAEVEGKIHDIPPDEIHFHEIGADDAIVDIVGTFALLEYFDFSKIYSSKINLGTGGTIKSDHGKLSNPAPATLELLKNVPVYSTIEGEETVTPTGAVLLLQLVDEFESFPPMRIKKVGRGAGEKDFSIPNVFRMFIGEQENSEPNDEKIMKIETNLDDCSPEILAYTMERLFDIGALDVYHVPIQMKKNRPSVKLVVLCDPCKIREVERVLFEETSTLGYRYIEMDKRELSRDVKDIQTKYGKVEVKIGYYDGERKLAPEFDICRELAEKNSVSLRKVYQEAIKEFNSPEEDDYGGN
ncbi:hypothetical protein AKJ39_04030 [candidate division MSBL1 archaeon SCGC-AAA259J03]|uniref:Putative nickel insertion protein n=1 Tax=candidate division MSBL1 archaeon SCGC-AAA259J03 TaxID=1698269 RepID=A0A656YW01_9EURY|nr:hypothetical protein AKJ39_04030 [candidate division MSBL1 archaeon SCGC-AAA259J03]